MFSSKSFNFKSKKGRLSKFKKSNLDYGSLGLKATESGIITDNQIESFKQTVFKKTSKKIKIWIKIFSCFYVTKKPVGIRMGKGIGKIAHKIYKITNGSVIFEFCGLNNKIIVKAVAISKLKLPIKTRILL